jgi:hypothetical protein
MELENKATEVPKTEVAKAPEVTSNEAERTISVDVYGVQVDLPMSKAKELITKRDEKTKGYKELQEKVSKAEAVAKQESDRAALMKAMKESDIDAVKAQVSSEYLDKINKYETKIFRGEVKSLLATSGVLPSALDDAVSLALQGAKVTLEGDEIKINDKVAKDAIEEFVKGRPHLVAVKSSEGKKLVKPGKPPEQKPSGQERLNKGLQSFLKP